MTDGAQVECWDAIDISWDGLPTKLCKANNSRFGTLRIRKTIDGSFVLALQNVATANNAGTVEVKSGRTLRLDLPAGANSPTIIANNWRTESLQVSNTSGATDTPILVTSFGPGMGGHVPIELPATSTPVTLAPGQVAAGTTPTGPMQLRLALPGAGRGVFAFIGGPQDASGNNSYVVAVNDSQTSGAGTNVDPPPGAYATTTDNTYVFEATWNGADVYVAYLGGAAISSFPGRRRSGEASDEGHGGEAARESQPPLDGGATVTLVAL